MLKMKKIISVVLMCAMMFSLAQVTALGAYTAPTTAEKQFNEDFEDYQILKLADEYNTAYYAGTSVYSSVINVAAPSDATFYTTYADKYPNGTASVYEGNLADAGMSVPDPSGKQITGGTKNIGQDDGWYGYYTGDNGNYNIYNRRLSVMSRNGTDEINQTQYASLNPRGNSTATGKSEFNRNNVALDGYSYISSRVNLSLDTSNKSFGKAGIAITKNPNKEAADATYDAVYFTDSATNGKLDVYFNGSAVGTVALSTFSYGSSSVTSSGEWYTIQYRIYNGKNAKKHKLTIIDDVNKAVVVDTNWTDINLTDSEFDFSDANTYGIRFYAHAPSADYRVRMRLDDISFHNGEYAEDFDSYNVKVVADPADTSKVVGNGQKGNRNITEVYTDDTGIYEGNVARNAYIHRALQKDTEGNVLKGENVYGGLPQWQGYVKTVVGTDDKPISEVGYVNAGSPYQIPCAVVLPTDRGHSANGFDTNALVIRAYTPKTKAQQKTYAGMDSVDFSDKTTLSAVIKIQQIGKNTKDSSLTLQLTKGKDTVQKGAANYDGNSHTGYFDVLKMENNKFVVGNEEIGDYEIKGAYRIEYTVDLTNAQAPKHEIKIFNNLTDVLVAHKSLDNMQLNTGADSFNFENDVTGFRFVADAPTYTDSTTYSDIIAYIDDVKVKKTLPASITGISYVNDAVYSAEDNKVTLTADMAEALNEASVFIFAVYDKNDVLKKVYKADYSSLNANENAIEITVTDDYAASDYYGRLFFWNNFDDLNPIAESVNAILK